RASFRVAHAGAGGFVSPRGEGPARARSFNLQPQSRLNGLFRLPADPGGGGDDCDPRPRHSGAARRPCVDGGPARPDDSSFLPDDLDDPLPFVQGAPGLQAPPAPLGASSDRARTRARSIVARALPARRGAGLRLVRAGGEADRPPTAQAGTGRVELSAISYQRSAISDQLSAKRPKNHE